ncbi:MAG: ABC transporter ATP-binding protein [Cyanobacteria bacterium P01_G01_bin.19]
MSESIIKVENLGKKYILGHQKKEKYTTLRDVIGNTVKSVLKTNNIGKNTQGEFWALDDLSFEIKQGDRVGIIGRNGAGKSTLLKILSRITEPTKGQIKIKGRISSLLEVGTGFHPELTGRENIFLNGAVLGMHKQEIKKKFDEIVAFAEVEKFLDTPVKRYSSGMYVRLAFAVAAHLEPEILIVDEVLAVGDAQFQKKCLGKMKDVGDEGRTVLFVSHNMAAIKALCDQGIFLSQGQLISQGDVEGIVDQYFLSGHETIGARETITSKCGRFELTSPYWINNEENKIKVYNFAENYRLRFEFNFKEPVSRVNPGFAIVDYMGQRIFTSHLADDPRVDFNRKLEGRVVIDTEINLPTLAPGVYGIIFGVRDEYENTVIYSEGELNLEIEGTVHKNGAGGVLLHTTDWKIASLVS